MPRPYQEDLRRRIIDWRFAEGFSRQETAQRAGCCEKTVKRLEDIWNTYHTLFPPYYRARGRPRQLDQWDMEYIYDCYEANPGMLLDELQDRFFFTLDTFVTIATLDRALQRLGETRKVMRKVAAERNEELRRVFKIHLALEYGINPDLFVFLDETAVDIDVGRKRYGYSFSGTRASRTEVFKHNGRRYSILPALSSTGVIGWRMYEGGVTKEEFKKFLREELVRNPQLLV
jgi:transposase